jgi:uncharacterized membrane protein
MVDGVGKCALARRIPGHYKLLSNFGALSPWPVMSTPREGEPRTVDSDAAADPLSSSQPPNTTPEAERVDVARVQTAVLHAREEELSNFIEKLVAEREAVRAEIKVAESELDAAVNAPVSGGRDPTEWLPEELLLAVMCALPAEMMWVCMRVCERWKRVMESAPVIKQLMHKGRWAEYEAGVMRPRALEGHKGWVFTIAVGLDGKVYSAGSSDKKRVRVWSGEDGTLLQTLKGHHSRSVEALAVGLDGKVYSGSRDTTICVWSGESGAHLNTLRGHVNMITCLAVGLDGKVYSGALDRMSTQICVWSGENGTHLDTLELEQTGDVHALAVGHDGTVYSGTSFGILEAWTSKGRLLWAKDDSEQRSNIRALAVGLDGTIYVGREHWTIEARSREGKLLRDVAGCQFGRPDPDVTALTFGADGRLFSAGDDGKIKVWSSNLALLHTFTQPSGSVCALAFSADGSLYSGGSSTNNSCVFKW